MSEPDEPARLLAFDLDRIASPLEALLGAELSDVASDRGTQLKRLQDIVTVLDDYNAEPYLLDASLEQLLSPAILHLRAYIHQNDVLDLASLRCVCLSRYLYHVIKVRGYKAVVRYFPHEVTDLDKLVNVFRSTESNGLSNAEAWQMRYLLLLWLSLVCRLPFDLAKWDRPHSNSSTENFLAELGIHYLGVPGKERDAAALMLGQLLIRRDVSQTILPSFISRAASHLENDAEPAFLSLGYLQTLCATVKAGSRHSLLFDLPALFQLLSLCGTGRIGMQNPLIRKFRVKLAGRLALMYLPRHRIPQRRTTHAFAISGTHFASTPSQLPSEHLSVPKEVEVLAQDLLDHVEDTDGSVRYSAAKHVARLVAALPATSGDEILDALVERFSVGIVSGPGGAADLSNVSDTRWQGICLAFAECARKAVIPPAFLKTLMPWLLKALTLDRRKGSRIVGANVRDAAAYVIWALARSQTPLDIQPYVNDLAQQLVIAACLDREIHIRRAASAAFQELVGRTGLVPHGIDVLRIIDFQTCGLRRSAYLIAAKETAGFTFYRELLFKHLLADRLQHYDSAIRSLAAQSLLEFARIDSNIRDMAITALLQDGIVKSISRMHGQLAGLSELAVVAEPDQLESIFRLVQTIPAISLNSFEGDLIIQAGCAALTSCIARLNSDLLENADITNFFVSAAKKTSPTCHDAAASVFSALSRKIDVSAEVKRLLAALTSFSPSAQLYAAKALSGLDVTDVPQQRVSIVFKRLLGFVQGNGAKSKPSYEARSKGLQSLTQLTIAGSTKLADADVRTVVEALLRGLEDYTTDTRGDVGSQIRTVCLICLADVAERLPTSLTDQDMLTAVAASLRMLVEKIDMVRKSAKCQIQRFIQARPSIFARYELLSRSLNSLDTCSLVEVLPRVLPFCSTNENVTTLGIVRGAIYGIGQPVEGFEQIPLKIFNGWFRQLPVSDSASASYSQHAFLKTLSDIAHVDHSLIHGTLPIVRILSFQLKSGDLAGLLQTDAQNVTNLCTALCDELDVVKSAPRALALTDLVVVMLSTPSLRSVAARYLKQTICHQSSKVRRYAWTAIRDCQWVQTCPEAAELIDQAELHATDPAIVAESLILLLS